MAISFFGALYNFSLSLSLLIFIYKNIKKKPVKN